MSNTQRKLQDPGANPTQMRTYPVSSSEEVQVGDLMWWDRANSVARPANATQAWTGTEAGTQGKIAKHFIGVARSAHLATAVVHEVQIEAEGDFHFPLASSATFEIGDGLAATRDASNNYMLRATVVKLTGGFGGNQTGDASRLIGRAAKRHATSVSQIEMAIKGAHVIGGGIRGLASS